MKNKKVRAILYFIMSVSFYLMAFASSFDNVSTAVVDLCIGSFFLYVGIVWLKKNKSEKEDGSK